MESPVSAAMPYFLSTPSALSPFLFFFIYFLAWLCAWLVLAVCSRTYNTYIHALSLSYILSYILVLVLALALALAGGLACNQSINPIQSNISILHSLACLLARSSLLRTEGWVGIRNIWGHHNTPILFLINPRLLLHDNLATGNNEQESHNVHYY